jgi:hypothetical protein
MESIFFNNREFFIREINFPKLGIVNISTSSLNSSLLTDSGVYTSNQAIQIDEKIFFYVEDDQIHLSNKILRKIISENLL